MGRRSRQRGEQSAAAPPPRARPARPPRPERPRAPWHPFPLVELSVLIGLVLLVWGLLRSDDGGGRVLLVTGMALASLGGLDTALREHFTGYKPHSFLIASLPAVLAGGVLFFAGAPWIAIPIAMVALLAGGFVLLRRGFERRTTSR